MANVINKVTLEYRGSVNTPEYSPSTWIINPDLSSVQSTPKKYWKIQGNSVVLMDTGERAVIDAQKVEADKDRTLLQAENTTKVLFLWAFAMTNDVRVLQGKSVITKAQFKAGLRAAL